MAMDIISRDDDGTPDMGEARTWARQARFGDYLALYSDYPGDDTGSRCGYSDEQLDDLSRILGKRGICLSANDKGLVACSDAP